MNVTPLLRVIPSKARDLGFAGSLSRPLHSPPQALTFFFANLGKILILYGLA